MDPDQDRPESEIAELKNRLDDVSRRLSGLEQLQNRDGQAVQILLADLQTRLSALEGKKAPIPPPVVATPTSFDLPQMKPAAEMAPPALVPPELEVPTVQPRVDVEERIWSFWAPRVGGVVLLIGLAYLVALGIGRGMITPWTQFAGACLLCLGLIAAGFRQHNQRVEFGQTLVGIGSCGLYVAFAGSHAFNNLFAAEILVAAFALLGLANLTYSHWKASRSFLAIGLIGGLVAAMLPLARGPNLALSAPLHFLILVPAAWIVGRNRWTDASMWLWLFAIVGGLAAITDDRAGWPYRVAMLHGTALVCLAARIHCQPISFDPRSVFIPVVVFATALMGVAVKPGPIGAVHVLALATSAVAIGLLVLRGTNPSRLLVGSGLAAAATIAPLCLTPVTAGVVLILLSAGAFGWAWTTGQRGVVAVAWADLLLALCAVVYGRMEGVVGSRSESAILLGALALTPAIGTLHRDRSWTPPYGGLAAALVAFVAIWRLAWVVLVEGQFQNPLFGKPEMAILIGNLVSVYTIGTAARRTRWFPVLNVAWLALIFSGLGYSAAVQTLSLPVWVDFGLVLALGGAVLIVVSAHSQCVSSKWAEHLVSLGGVLFLIPMARLGWLVGTPFAAPNSVTLVLVLGVFAMGTAIYCLRQGWVGPAIAAWLALLGMFGVVMIQDLGLAPVAWLSLWTLATLVVGTTATARLSADDRPVLSVGILMGWALVSRLAIVVLASESVGMRWQGALTFGWLLTAVALMVLGFLLENRLFRHWSLVVFGATLFKVFLFDLSHLDPGVRVVALTGLGLAMILGGYWYIRRNSRGI